MQLIMKSLTSPLLTKFKDVSENGFELHLEGTFPPNLRLNVVNPIREIESILNLEEFL